MTNHPNRNQVVLEIGKTYVTRDGQRVTIEAETADRGTYRMQGVDEQGRVTWRSRRGRFEGRPHVLDLVRPAPARGPRKGHKNNPIEAES